MCSHFGIAKHYTTKALPVVHFLRRYLQTRPIYLMNFANRMGSWRPGVPAPTDPISPLLARLLNHPARAENALDKGKTTDYTFLMHNKFAREYLLFLDGIRFALSVASRDDALCWSLFLTGCTNGTSFGESWGKIHHSTSS
jgi:hypothetical protein